MHQKPLSSVVQRVSWLLIPKFGMSGEWVGNEWWWAQVRHWNWKESIYRPFMKTSLFFLDMLQTDKDLYFPSPLAFYCGICCLGTYFVENLSYCMENEKRAIVQVMMMSSIWKQWSILQALWPLALKLGILEPFILLMTNNCEFVSKKQNRSMYCVMMTSSLC